MSFFLQEQSGEHSRQSRLTHDPRDQHCHTMVGCNLRQKQLQQGQHLKKRCKLWAPTWQKEVGWAPEAG
jgi:hypothetical protein